MGIYNLISEQLSAGKTLALVTPLIDKDTRDKFFTAKIIISEENRIIYGRPNLNLADQLIKTVIKQLKKGQSAVVVVPAGEGSKEQLFVQVLKPLPRLIIMGGGHVGAALCRMAAELDYEIVLIDDRPTFASRNLHPLANHLICEQYDRALDLLKPSGSDYYVIVTRGHRYDRLCLEKLLNRDAAYIGMIGSRSRVKKQLHDMAEAGCDEKKLAGVHAPIGLPIGAVTEGEIAVSILAEMTSIRRSAGSDEALQDAVLNELCRLEQEGKQAVLATVIAANGSTPRKAGSQMIVFPDGSLLGTIGGGCSEAEVRREALLSLDSGEPGFVRLSLTADQAAEEGMACGGTMDVYLDPLPIIS